MNLAYLPLLMAFWKGGALYLCSKRTADVLRFRYAAAAGQMAVCEAMLSHGSCWNRALRQSNLTPVQRGWIHLNGSCTTPALPVMLSAVGCPQLGQCVQYTSEVA